jgi:catechol 2,3-dioxygenase-like lactoylglutathione lyase family enzyme
MPARIRHLAIACKDNEAVAEFYKSVFGMVEVARDPDKRDPNVFHISLSDGHIRLALIPDIVGYPEGINHFGFQVDDLERVTDRALASGATSGDDRPRGAGTEVVVIDPTGTRVDIREKGWGQATPEQIAAADQSN